MAWQRRQFRDCWVISRRIPGGRFGPKRRMLKNPRLLPSAQDVMEKFGADGKDGGCNAIRLANRTSCHEAATGPKTVVNGGIKVAILAAQDFAALLRWFAGCKLRKYTPIWALPAEVWRLCFCHDWTSTKTRYGIGCNAKNLGKSESKVSFISQQGPVENRKIASKWEKNVSTFVDDADLMKSRCTRLGLTQKLKLNKSLHQEYRHGSNNCY